MELRCGCSVVVGRLCWADCTTCVDTLGRRCGFDQSQCDRFRLPSERKLRTQRTVDDGVALSLVLLTSYGGEEMSNFEEAIATGDMVTER